MTFMLAFMVAMRAHEKSATKAHRLKEAWKGKRAKVKDKPLTFRAPGWLQMNKEATSFQVLEDRAEVVRRIYKLTLDGVGNHSIAATLNKEQVPVFGRGKHWLPSYITKFLCNPVVVGVMVPHVREDVDGK
jgi:hypothetical protein